MFKNLKLLLTNQTGFTLGELLVCVGIVGFLSSVSVPVYDHYIIKSRSTEGLMVLSGLNRGMDSWIAEFDTYASCINEMGVTKPFSHFYSYGFTRPNAGVNQDAVDAGAIGTCRTVITEDRHMHRGTMAMHGGSPFTAAAIIFLLGNYEVTSNTTYNAYALGNIGQFANYKKDYNPMNFIIPKAYASQAPPDVENVNQGEGDPGSFRTDQTGAIWSMQGVECANSFGCGGEDEGQGGGGGAF